MSAAAGRRCWQRLAYPRRRTDAPPCEPLGPPRIRNAIASVATATPSAPRRPSTCPRSASGGHPCIERKQQQPERARRERDDDEQDHCLMPGVERVRRRRGNVEPVDGEGASSPRGRWRGQLSRHPPGLLVTVSSRWTRPSQAARRYSTTRGGEDQHRRRPWRGHGRDDAHDRSLGRATAQAKYPHEPERSDESLRSRTRRPRQPRTRDVAQPGKDREGATSPPPRC